MRFASFYTGEDPTAKNYDPVHKVIRSVLNGSRGPKLEVAAEYWYDKSASRHPGSKMTLENFFGDWTNVKGDIPMNLHATSLVSNAYLLTGEQKYKDWLVEYVGAWAGSDESKQGKYSRQYWAEWKSRRALGREMVGRHHGLGLAVRRVSVDGTWGPARPC